eukprot:2555971-Rhodomonas_salina.1
MVVGGGQGLCLSERDAERFEDACVWRCWPVCKRCWPVCKRARSWLCAARARGSCEREQSRAGAAGVRREEAGRSVCARVREDDDVCARGVCARPGAVSYTHLRAHETEADL